MTLLPHPSQSSAKDDELSSGGCCLDRLSSSLCPRISLLGSPADISLAGSAIYFGSGLLAEKVQKFRDGAADKIGTFGARPVLLTIFCQHVGN
ncbi:MAG: hypothetical protein WBQ24_13120 [Xanthobacteraceae bacterium]